MDIQLAIQGGGAKLWALLAAMEALQDLESSGMIRVTRIAGTSAGAIAGCIFAAGIPVKDVRQALLSERGQQLVQSFPRLRFWHGLRLLASGKPLWNEKVLGKALAEIFGQAQAHQLSDLKHSEMIVVAADLAGGGRIVHGGHSNIVDSLLDSCGIPYCFRTWRRGPIVDGGLCENLPIEELLSEEKTKGPVAAITFSPRWKGAPENLIEFSTALLDTAINNSVQRARQRLGPEAIFQIDGQVGTFELEGALEKLRTEYKSVKVDATEFFRSFITAGRRHKVFGDPWSLNSVPMMKTLGQIYSAQHQTPLSYDRGTLLVRVNSLLPTPEADEVTYTVLFRTLDDAVYCYRIALSEPTSGQSFLSESTWEVYDSNGRAIETFHLPMMDTHTKSGRELLLFFNPVLPRNSGPYKLVFRDRIDGFFRQLRETGNDELVWSTRRARGPIGRIDLVMHVPENFQNVELMPLRSGRVAGRQMFPVELADFAAPQGFRPYGWIGASLETADLAPDGSFGMYLKIR